MGGCGGAGGDQVELAAAVLNVNPEHERSEREEASTSDVVVGRVRGVLDGMRWKFRGKQTHSIALAPIGIHIAGKRACIDRILPFMKESDARHRFRVAKIQIQATSTSRGSGQSGERTDAHQSPPTYAPLTPCCFGFLCDISRTFALLLFCMCCSFILGKVVA